MNDRIILYLAAFLRALALGMVSVLLAIYLSKIQFSPSILGIIINLGLTVLIFGLQRLFTTYFYIFHFEK